MSPASPVLPSVGPIHETVIAKNQPEYIPLPAIISGDRDMVTTRWSLSLVERLRILITGSLYHQQMVFGGKAQPIKMSVVAPKSEECL